MNLISTNFKKKPGEMNAFKAIGRLFTISVCLQLCGCSQSDDARAIKLDDKYSSQSIDRHTTELLESSSFRIINETVAQANIRELVDEVLPAESQEFRIWVGFSHKGIKGFIVRKNRNSYLATYIPSSDRQGSVIVPKLLPSPQDGYEVLLEKLRDLTSSTESSKDSEKTYPHDGIAAILEVKTPASYKAYKYLGVLYNKEKALEVQKIEEVIDLVSKLFNVNLY